VSIHTSLAERLGGTGRGVPVVQRNYLDQDPCADLANVPTLGLLARLAL
jgi:hypothetical protein